MLHDVQDCKGGVSFSSHLLIPFQKAQSKSHLSGSELADSKKKKRKKKKYRVDDRSSSKASNLHALISVLLHVVHLLHTGHPRLPAWPQWRIQLSSGLGSLQRILIIQNASPDNLHTGKVFGIAVESASAITTEVVGDCLATVRDFGKGLGVASHLEVVTRNYAIGAESAAGRLLAITTVAERLTSHISSVIMARRRDGGDFLIGAHLHGRLSIVRNANLSAHTASLGHLD